MVAIHRICAIVVVLLVVPALHVRPSSPSPNPDMIHYLSASKSSYQHFAAETEKMLHADVLDVWYPGSIDHVHGGFNADFARDWSPLPSHGKFSVFQGRPQAIAQGRTEKAAAPPPSALATVC